jgi:hypothetical protein
VKTTLSPPPPPPFTTQAELVAKFATGVFETGGKFATGVVDTGRNFATGVIDTGCRWHQWCTLTCEYLREISKKYEMALKLRYKIVKKMF